MANYTENLNLFKYDTVADAQVPFSINDALNQNWDILDEAFNNKADTDLSNLNETGEKHFLNKSQVSNCILEAPNGVITYSGNTVTLKAGVKVLIPNGRNSDGTLNNIELVLNNDVTRTETINVNMYIFVNIDKEITWYYPPDVLFLDKIDTNKVNSRQYVVNENKWYDIDGSGNTVLRQISPLGIVYASNNTFTGFTPFNTVDLLKRSDKFEISGWGMPSDKYINLTLGASGSIYTAPANGYYNIGRVTNGQNPQYVDLVNTTTGFFVSQNNEISSIIRLNAPVRKGDVLRINYTAVGGSSDFFRFYYAVGSESEAQ